MSNEAPEVAAPSTEPVVSKFKASIDADKYAKVKKLIKHVVNKHSTNPITRNVRLFVRDRVLWLEATDLEQCLTAQLGKAEGDGSCLLDAGWLDGLSSIEVNGLQLTLLGSGKRQLCGQDPQEYPKLPEFAFDYQLSIKTEGLLSALKACIGKVALERGRYALNGVLIDAVRKGKGFEFCGTDGRRLAYAEAYGKTECLLTAEQMKERKLHEKFATELPYQLIVHPNALEFILLAEKSIQAEETWLYVSEKRIGLAGREDGLQYQSLISEGQFPDYRSVIPKDLDLAIVVEREPLVAALQEVKKCCTEASAAIRLCGMPDGLEVRSKSHLGEAVVTVPLERVPHPLAYGLDPEYLLEALEHYPTRYVVLEMKDQETGMILHAGEKNKRYDLIMPIDFDSRPELGIKPEPWTEEELNKVMIWDDGISKRRPLNDQERLQHIAERNSAIEAYEQSKIELEAKIAQWEVRARKVESTHNGKLKIGTPIGCDNPTTPENLYLRQAHEARASRNVRRASEKPKNRNTENETTTGVKQGRPEGEVKTVYIDRDDQAAKETPESLGMQSAKGQWSFGW